MVIHIAKHNQKLTLKEVEALVPESINTVTPALWKKFVSTQRRLRSTGKKNGLVEDVVEEILINVGGDSDDESSDEELEPDDNDLQYLQWQSLFHHLLSL